MAIGDGDNAFGEGDFEVSPEIMDFFRMVSGKSPYVENRKWDQNSFEHDNSGWDCEY